jgi:hypothetical protein
LSTFACPTVQGFPTLPQKEGMIFEKKVTEQKMRVLMSSTGVCGTFLILRRNAQKYTQVSM